MTEDRAEDPSGPPGDVSDQNGEEASAPHPAAGGDSSSGEPGETGHPPDSEKPSSERGEGRPGGAGEGSQATGHPHNAG
jgi:hypothetical protein